MGCRVCLRGHLNTTLHLVAWLVAYALGCLNTGYYWVRLTRRQDIREFASGSTGARNVGRLLGPTGFTVTFAGDAIKAWAAIAFGLALVPHSAQIFWSLPCLVIGHVYPVQMGFRGGKGVSVALGGAVVLAAYSPRIDFSNDLLSVLAACVVAIALVLFAHRSHLAKKRVTWQPDPDPKIVSDPEFRP
jgi:acyl-phosphate glycerol 3-phosphate acyltransferase